MTSPKIHEKQSIIAKLASSNKLGNPFYVIEKNNQIIGSAAVRIFSDLAWLYGMAIFPDYQHQGLGTKLLSFIIDSLESKSIKSISLYSSKAGLGLYKKFGFKYKLETNMCRINSPQMKTSDDGSKVFVEKGLSSRFLEIDKKIFGYDRAQFYKRFRGMKTYCIFERNGGVGFLRDNILGPIFASKPDQTIKIINEAWKLGAKALTINSELWQKVDLFAEISIDYLSTISNPLMTLGKPLKSDYSRIYAIASFSSG